LGSIELFCLAAELESFTAAAAAASVNPAAVSRSVAGLRNASGYSCSSGQRDRFDDGRGKAVL